MVLVCTHAIKIGRVFFVCFNKFYAGKGFCDIFRPNEGPKIKLFNDLFKWNIFCTLISSVKNLHNELEINTLKKFNCIYLFVEFSLTLYFLQAIKTIYNLTNSCWSRIYLKKSLLSIFCLIIERNGSSVKGWINIAPDKIASRPNR